MKLLSGKDLASYIKERQSRDIRAIKQSYHVTPKLAIVVTVDNPVINVFIKLKKSYGADIQADVDIYRVDQGEVPSTLNKLNEDNTVHGIIVQLPLEDTSKTDEIVSLVAPEKDV